MKAHTVTINGFEVTARRECGEWVIQSKGMTTQYFSDTKWTMKSAIEFVGEFLVIDRDLKE